MTNNYWSGRQDLNPRPSGPKPDALPSCATPRYKKINGAGDGTRTRDLLITSQLLYQLSYTGTALIKWRPGRDSNPRPLA